MKHTSPQFHCRVRPVAAACAAFQSEGRALSAGRGAVV